MRDIGNECQTRPVNFLQTRHGLTQCARSLGHALFQFGVCPANGFFSLLALRDIAVDAQQSRDLTGAVTQRHLGCQHPVRVAIGVPNDGLAIDARLIVKQKRPLLRQKLLRQSTREVVEIGFPNELGGRGGTKKTGSHGVYGYESALRILHIDLIRNAVDDAEQKIVFHDQRLLHTAPLQGIADRARQH